MIYDILIVVDCKGIPTDQLTHRDGNRISMYAADPSIVVTPAANSGEGQGGNELYIQVPAGSIVRWHATPLQVTKGPGVEDQDLLHLIISRVAVYTTNQGPSYVPSWNAYSGNHSGAIQAYTKQGSIPFVNSDSTPRHKGTGEIPIQNVLVGTDRPFVETTTTLPNPDSSESGRLSYTFNCKVYSGATYLSEISWDPHLKVT